MTVKILIVVTFAALNESSDEILAKYRRKPSLTDSNNDSPLSLNREPNSNAANHTGSVSSSSVARKDSLKISRSDLITESRKKLRNVLSNCDLQISQVNCCITILEVAFIAEL